MTPENNKYTLYRGSPYSGLDFDSLRGRGGYGHEMLGGGLYLTDEYTGAATYATPASARYMDRSKDTRPCVYELELDIPEQDILYVGGRSLDVRVCEVPETSSIPFIFGVHRPAFELQLVCRITNNKFTYLISETEDPLEHTEAKLECANEVLDDLGLGQMHEYMDFDEYVDDEFGWTDMYEDYLETYQEYIKLAGGDESRVLRNIQDRIDAKIREVSGLPNYGEYDKHPNILGRRLHETFDNCL